MLERYEKEKVTVFKTTPRHYAEQCAHNQEQSRGQRHCEGEMLCLFMLLAHGKNTGSFEGNKRMDRSKQAKKDVN